MKLALAALLLNAVACASNTQLSTATHSELACSEAKRGDAEHLVVITKELNGSLLPGVPIKAVNTGGEKRLGVTDQYGQAELTLSSGVWQVTSELGESKHTARVPVIVRDRCLLLVYLEIGPKVLAPPN